MVLPNYELIEKIADSDLAAIYKAYHKKNPERLLVLKVLKATSLSDHKKAQFRQKIEHLKVLNDPLVITPIAFGDEGRDLLHHPGLLRRGHPRQAAWSPFTGCP